MHVLSATNFKQQEQKARIFQPVPKKTPQIFSEVVKEWLKVRITGKAENYLRTIYFRLNKHILPEIGTMTLKEIEAPDILHLCRKIEDTGHAKIARRVKTVIGKFLDALLLQAGQNIPLRLPYSVR